MLLEGFEDCVIDLDILRCGQVNLDVVVEGRSFWSRREGWFLDW